MLFARLVPLVLCFVAVQGTIYQPDDPNLYYSPFAWHITNESAATINSASYIRFLFSGT